MRDEINMRVGAILGATSECVEFLGYGIYVGDEVPKEAVGFTAQTLYDDEINPKIILDSGKVVYGCECWWGPEEEIKEELSRHAKIIEVDIDQVREKHLKEKP